MINHMRTLLLNQNDLAGGVQSGQPGVELVDPGFQPQVLPQWLRDIRAAILPAGYTAYQQNMALMYIMNILHAPELEPYTLAMDTRTTYTDATLYSDFTSLGVEVTSWRTPACDVELKHALTAAKKWTSAGTVLYWTIRNVANTTNHVSVQHTNKPPVISKLTFVNHYSNSLALVPDYMTFKLYSPTEQLSGEFKFDITLYAPITLDAPAILARFNHLTLRHSTTQSIFEPYAPYTSELNELQQIWQYSSEMLLRLGAYILALGYQCERLRRGRVG